MGKAVGGLTDAIGLTDYSGLMDQTRRGGQAALGGMQEALDYLKEADKLPRQYREQALQQIAGIYGIGEGGAEAKQQFYQGLTDDPYYKMMSQGAEEAYLRNQSATGDLRGGGSIMGVANLENQIRQATMQNQLGGLQGIMGMTPDYTESIYGGISGIGQQKGMNIMNLAQQQQANNQAAMGNVLGMGKMIAGFL